MTKSNNNKAPSAPKKNGRTSRSSVTEKSAEKKETVKRSENLKIFRQDAETPRDTVQNLRREAKKTPPLKIISLGGLDEIGKNMTVYEYGNDMFIIDCGMTFPDDEMPGVDIVIPDFSYVVKNADRVKGLVITHGHEDHIGGIPYLLKVLNCPIYATKLTVGSYRGKIKGTRPAFQGKA